MKNKLFLLGFLIAVFCISIPLYADPGGTSISSFEVSAYQSPAVAPMSTLIEPAVTVTVVVSSAVVIGTLFLLEVRRRSAAVPWRPFLGKTLKTIRMNVRRNFDKLTKSPVLKSLAA